MNLEVILYINGIILLISLCIILYNFLTAPSLKYTSREVSIPEEKISVLIPARNEELNISKCLNHIVNQDYDIHEIIVLDDQSTDRTRDIANEYAKEYSLIKVIEGKPLPENWIGKTWACQQLGEASQGNILMFIDADVELKPWALRSAFKLFQENKLKMLSCFPTQRMKCTGEWITVPLMNWLLLSFLPLKLVYSSGHKSFVAANGQFIMAERKTYIEMGAHTKVAEKVVEDMELARAYKLSNHRIMTALGNDTVYCRMYTNLYSALNGFRKNFYAGFNVPASLFFILITILFTVYLLPFFLVFYNTNYIYLIVLIIMARIFISLLSRQKLIPNIILHPLQMIVMFFTGVSSIIANKSKGMVWKGRSI